MADQEVKTRFSFFVESAEGLKGYIEVALADVPPSADPPLDTFYAEFKRIADWLPTQGFKHDASFDKPARGGGKPPQPPPSVKVGDKTVEVTCGKCHGPIWDNRKENDEREAKGQRRRPDFACKKKDECGWIAWNAFDVEVALSPDEIPFDE